MSKTVLVTGAAGGIGEVLVDRLRARGDDVVASDMSGADAFLDVRSPEDWARVVGDVLATRQRIDVLINLAGVSTASRFWELDTADIHRHLDINIKGVALGCHIIVPRMLAAGGGHIVNVASLAGLAPVPGLAMYSASKFALRGLSIALAMELEGTGVAVSVVHPDVTETPMIARQKSDPAAAVSFSGKRTLSPLEVASVITDDVLLRRPLEVSIPRSRGALCKVASAFPNLARRMLPPLRRKGLARQRSEHQPEIAP